MNNRGITLIVLIVTIIVMVIIASTAIYVGTSTVNQSNLTKFNTELRIIRAKVNEFVEQKVDTSTYGKSMESVSVAIRHTASTILETNDLSGYKYFDKEELDKLGISQINRKILINFTTRDIVDMNGVLKGNNYIYRLDDGSSNVQYEAPTSTSPTFNIEKKVYGLTAEITVKNIVYNGDVGSGTISYAEVINNVIGIYKTVNENKILIEKDGIYRIKLTDSLGNFSEQQIEVVLCNKPKVTQGMIPVVYNATLNSWVKADELGGQWFDYSSNQKKWANIVTVKETGTQTREFYKNANSRNCYS